MTKGYNNLLENWFTYIQYVQAVEVKDVLWHEHILLLI